MAGKRLTNSGAWEYVFKRSGLLDSPKYLTFETREEGDAREAQIEAMMDKGIIPPEFHSRKRLLTIGDLIGAYTRDAHPSNKDRDILRGLDRAIGSVKLIKIDAPWLDNWITQMKRVDKVAPNTIRSKVGALSRCCKWGARKGHVMLPDAPFDTLSHNYSQYTEADAAAAGVMRTDIERDRRLEPGEYEAILRVIDGGVLPRKLEPYQIPDKRAVAFLFKLAVESAMRLREMYTLTLDQVDQRQRTVFLDRTKNGDKRQVPLSSVAMAELKAYLEVRQIPEGHPEDALFPWWDGSLDVNDLHRLSDDLSSLFAEIFALAGAKDFRFHDTRHEAVSRLFERTRLSEAKIMKISGHRSQKTMMRYANLRGSDLVDELW